MIDKIISILQDIVPYEEIKAEEDLFENELLDSLSFAELLGLLEKEFQVRIPEDKIRGEYFRTPMKIEALIESLR